MYKIKNWEKFNLYKAKNPRYQKKMTWFKFYGTDYINNIEIHKTQITLHYPLIC